jgi:hypothetical protein
MPSRSFECRKNLSNENLTLSKGIRDSVEYVENFCLIFIKFGKGSAHKKFVEYVLVSLKFIEWNSHFTRKRK